MRRARAIGRRDARGAQEMSARVKIDFVSDASCPWCVIEHEALPTPSCLDLGDVDLLHRHHRLEGTLCLSATGGQRVSEGARGDLPAKAPAVLAPSTIAFF